MEFDRRDTIQAREKLPNVHVVQLFQMCFASSVRLAYFLSRNDSLCCVYRCFNVPSVRCSSFLCRLCLWSRWLCRTR